MSEEPPFDLADFPAPEEHGPIDLPDAPISRRTVKSVVWGGVPARISTENAMDVHEWNPDCSWYQYGKQLCLNGCQHPGMDIAIERGTRLFAAEGGRVEFAGPANAYRPHFVSVQSDSGSLQIYGHMWTVDPGVVTNGRVDAGQFLGTSGEQTKRGTMTPDGSGAHLHFEVRKGGCSIDPEPILVGAVSSGETGGSSSPRFSQGDALRVVEGPLNVRSAPGAAAGIVTSIDAGVRLVVLSGPERSGEHQWFEVQAIGQRHRGWVAGTFCEAIEI